jgi:P27 family predicted phage terminase small subunit
MARTGRPATPNHLKAVSGVRESRLNRNEPVPTLAADPSVPVDGIPEAAQAVWQRLAPDLVDKRVLTAWDVDQFAAYCVAVAQYNECRERMGDQYVVEGSMGQMVKSPYWTQMNEALQQMMRLSARFGLTPADRAGLTIGADEPPKVGGERLLG